MNDISIQSSGLRSAFARAARAHEAARNGSVAPFPAPSTERANPAQSTTHQTSAPQRTATQVQPSVEQAIASASRQTGVDYGFLMAQAQVESAMNPTARARTSSATGLYQFIESTWLGTMQRHGERFGLGNIASQISTSQSGAAFVSDPATRASILEMRNDPQIASLMAAGLAQDNSAHLAPILGRQPDNTELYLAHFLGAGGAGRFLSAMEENPNQRADTLFRRPAAANRPVFYEQDGSPRSLAGVMNYLSGKLAMAGANTPAARGNEVSPLPYLAGGEGVLGPFTPPVMAGSNRPMISQRSAVGGISLPAPAPTTRPSQSASSQARPPMSSLLAESFGQIPTTSDSRSAEHIRRAYQQLKAFGL